MRGDFTARKDLPVGRGEIGQLAGYIHSMAQELEAEESLRKIEAGRVQESNDELRVIYDEVVDGVIVFDRGVEGFPCIKANPAAHAIFGYDSESIIGLSVSVLHPLKELPEIMTSYFSMVRGKRHLVECAPCMRKSGEVFPADIVARGITLKGRQALLCFYRDVTGRRLMEAKAANTQKMESVGLLAAGIAHEINTPIQFVGDNLTFMKDSFGQIASCVDTAMARGGSEISEIFKGADWDYLKSEIPAAIDQSCEGTNRVAKIVRAMKEFSHPDASSRITADLRHAIETTVTISRNEWKHVADITIDVDPTLPPVPCHIGELNQALLNLIINAAHAIAEAAAYGESAVKGVIAIRARKDGDMAVIDVSDTGAGIPESIRHRIFEPFFTTKGIGKGTGQGLSFVYAAIAKRHGGSVTFDSEVGKGTTFTMRLPLNIDGARSSHEMGVAASVRLPL